MIILLIITGGVVFTFFMFPENSLDLWFHLSYGRYMIENHCFPRTELFSYSAYGTPWYSFSWAFDILSYLGYTTIGIEGINIIKAIIGVLVFLTIVLFLRYKKALNLFSLLFVTLGLFSIREHFSLRPHTIGHLLFVLFFILLLMYKDKRTFKYLSLLFFTQFLWVNFHAGFIYGIAFSSFLFISDWINKIREQTRMSIPAKKFLLLDLYLMIGMLVASSVHVFCGYDFLLRTVKGYLFASLKYPVLEHLPPNLSSFLSLMGLIFLTLFPILFFSLKEKNYAIFLACLFTAGIGLRSMRFIFDLILLLCIVTPIYFNKYFARLKGIMKTVPNSVINTAYYIILFILFLLVKNHPLGFKNGIQAFTYPISAVDFIKSNKLLELSGGKIYNTYNFGGYLTWALYPHQIYIDGRMPGPVLDSYLKNFEGSTFWEGTVEKYKITVALMTLPHTDGRKIYNNSAVMFPKSEWALIYYDDVSAIYVKRIPALREIIDKYEYHILDPQSITPDYLKYNLQSPEEFNKVIAELDRAISVNPNSYRLHFIKSYMYNLVGLEKEMLDELRATLSSNPHFKPALSIMNSYGSRFF